MNTSRRRTPAVSLAALAGLAAGALSSIAVGAQEPADLLLHHGKIFTADDLMSVHEAVVIRGDEIVSVGGNELTERYDARREIDLRGRLVTPGFIDTHVHMGGDPPWRVDLSGAESMEELRELIRRRAEEVGSGKWVTGEDWSEDNLAEGRRPLRGDLDGAAPDNPVYIVRAGSHSGVANSRALEIAGVTPATPEPEGGIIEVNDEGRLNGVLRESAQTLVTEHIPEASAEELRPSFVQNLKGLLELGITTFVNAGIRDANAFGEWETIYREHGEELPRATVQVRTGVRDGRLTTEEAIDLLRWFGKTTGDGDRRLRVGALKVTVDGGFTGPAAWTLEHYPGRPDYYGRQLRPEPQLYRLSKAAHDMGWQLGYHAIGDAAIQMTVDVFARVLDESPRTDHRHYLNHFTVLPPEETLRQMVEYNILVAQQPNFTYTLAGRYRDNLAGERLQTNNALRTPMSRGIFMAFGSDNLPIDPRVGLYAATTRKGREGLVYGKEERIGMAEALAAYTRNSAYITREEDIKGTLEPGKLADLIVLDRDLLTVEPSEIMDTEVDLTIVGGEVLYEREPGAAAASR